MCLDYHCFWTPLSLFQALRHRQWAVFSSSIGYNLALITIPNIQNYVFIWVVFSGGYFDWGAEYSWQTGQVDPYWAKVLLGVLAANFACALSLFLTMTFASFELGTDPCGIIIVAELVWDKRPADFGLDRTHEEAPFESIAIELCDQVFHARRDGNSTRLEVVSTPIPQAQSPTSSSRTPSAQRHCVRRALDWTSHRFSSCKQMIRHYSLKAEKWMNGSPYPFLLRRIPLLLWIAFLAIIIAANGYVVQRMITPQQLIDQNYALPWNPSLYIVTGVFIQVNPSNPEEEVY